MNYLIEVHAANGNTCSTHCITAPTGLDACKRARRYLGRQQVGELLVDDTTGAWAYYTTVPAGRMSYVIGSYWWAARHLRWLVRRR